MKCRACGHRYTRATAWTTSRLTDGTKRRLLGLFVLVVPVYRQRFRALASAPAIEGSYRLVRACYAHAEELREPFEDPIECDETTIGGARHGKRSWGAARKVIVLGILQRNGQVRVFAVPAREGKGVIGLVRAHTKPGSLYYTDDWQAYGSLRVQGDHEWFGRSEADRKVEITSTGSKASEAMRKTGCIRSAEYPGNIFIFSWGRFAPVSIIETRTSSLCFTIS